MRNAWYSCENTWLRVLSGLLDYDGEQYELEFLGLKALFWSQSFDVTSNPA